MSTENEENLANDENKRVQGPRGNNQILNAFKQEFSTTVNVVHVNSLGRDVGFREITVNEQKTLSKIMYQNEQRKDVVYDTQCQLINKLCLDDSFDVYKVTEFDRIKILMDIYSGNYFNNDIRYKCPECGTENVYRLDFPKLMAKLDEFKLDDVVFNAEDRQRNYTFVLNYPYVSSVSNFYRNYMKTYKNVTTKEREVLDSIGNIDYTNLFIKEIQMVKKDDPGNKLTADLTIMNHKEVEDLISLFPQEMVFSEKNGVLKFITTEFIDRINSVFQYEKCAQCGHQTQEGLGSVIDFF